MNERLYALAKRVDDLGETVTMFKDPVDGHTVAALGWEELERLLNRLDNMVYVDLFPKPSNQDADWQVHYVDHLNTMITALDEHVTMDDAVRVLRELADVMAGTDLADATVVPEEGRRVANAGEFAAAWNARTATQREDLVVQLLHQQDTSRNCCQQDHDAMVKAWPSVRLLEDVEINRLAQYFYEEADGRHNFTINLAMVNKAGLVSALRGALQRIDRFQPTRANAWITEQLHEDCVQCEHMVEAAIAHAKVTGSIGATYTDAGVTAEHSATVRRA